MIEFGKDSEVNSSLVKKSVMGFLMIDHKGT